MVGNDLPTLHRPRGHEVFSQSTNVIRVDDKKQSSKWISGPIKVTRHVMVMDFGRPYAYTKCTHPIFKKKKKKEKKNSLHQKEGSSRSTRIQVINHQRWSCLSI